MNTLQEMKEVIDGAIAGKIVQRDYGDDQWLDTNPLFNFSVYTYRVKPEPKPDVVKQTHIRLYDCGGIALTGGTANLQLIFDGETGELKAAEVLK